MPNFDYLTDEQLLESIIPSSAVKEMIANYGGVQQALLNTTAKELETFPSIGISRAKQICYITELAKRLHSKLNPPPTAIKKPEDIFSICKEMQTFEIEEFRVVHLNAKNAILTQSKISRGSLTSTLVTPREIFCPAVRIRAAHVALVHNHPTGIPTPSDEDKIFTKKIIEVGKMLEIPVIDHVIIGKGQYFSLKEEGLF